MVLVGCSVELGIGLVSEGEEESTLTELGGETV